MTCRFVHDSSDGDEVMLGFRLIGRSELLKGEMAKVALGFGKVRLCPADLAPSQEQKKRHSLMSEPLNRTLVSAPGK